MRLLVLAGTLALGGCLAPMYGQYAEGGPGLQTELQAIAIEPIPERIGHYLGDDLIFDLNGTGSHIAPKYRLFVTLNESVQTPLIDTVSGRASSATVVINANYRLADYRTGLEITKGTAFVFKSYDRTSQRFANLRAARDAEIHDAKELSDQLRIRVAAAYRTPGSLDRGMVAVRSSEADRFINHPPAGVFLYLVFGSDTGLVAERMRTILVRAVDDPKDAFQLVRLDGDDVAADPLRLADEANAIPMFGGRKAIGIEATGRSLLPALDLILRAPPRDCVIAIEGGALKRDHQLRKLIEKERVAAAIECVPDSARDIAQLIDAELASAGLTIEPDAKELLLSLLGQDRLSTRSELDKLATYAHGEGRVEVAHVEAIVADASALVLDHAIDGAFKGAFAEIEATTERLFAENGDVNQLLGAALRHATALHRARIAIESGGGADGGFYGPRRAAAEQQLRLWDGPRLAKVVTALGDAVGKARREPRLAQAIAVRAFWSVALAARGREA